MMFTRKVKQLKEQIGSQAIVPIVGMGAEFVKYKKAQLEQKKLMHRDESILGTSPAK